MRAFCWSCHKSVSNDLPNDTILRCVCVCPECVEKGFVFFPKDEEQSFESDYKQLSLPFED